MISLAQQWVICGELFITSQIIVGVSFGSGDMKNGIVLAVALPLVGLGYNKWKAVIKPPLSVATSRNKYEQHNSIFF